MEKIFRNIVNSGWDVPAGSQRPRLFAGK